PSVVVSASDDVELVATHRSVFVLPDGARGRLDEQPLRVADAVGKDLGPRIRPMDERIVLRDRPVVVQPQDLAFVRPEILRRLVFGAFSDGHVDRAVEAERDARSGVAAVRAPGIGYEEISYAGERRAVEPRVRERGRVAALTAFGVGEVDDPRLR